MRPCARAAFALALVLPAALSGAEAIYYGNKTGLAGDDYTGLLALAAAPVLLALGVSTLWTSRRLGDKLAWRYTRRLLQTAGVFVALSLLAIPLRSRTSAPTWRAPRCPRRAWAPPTRTSRSRPPTASSSRAGTCRRGTEQR